MLMDNIVVRALSRLFDLILLNILWVLFSLPLVTVGASTAALYSVMMKIVANEEGYIIRGFLDAFRRNLKQSTVVWLMLLAAGAVLAADVMILGSFTGMPAKAGLVLLGAVAFIYLTELIFVFPLIARFENTTFAGYVPYGSQRVSHFFESGDDYGWGRVMECDWRFASGICQLLSAS